MPSPFDTFPEEAYPIAPKKPAAMVTTTEEDVETQETDTASYLADLRKGPSQPVAPVDTGSGLGKFFKGLAYGGQSAAAALPKAADRLATYISEKTGWEKEGLFKGIADAIKPEEIDQMTADDINFKIGKVIAGIGGGVVQIGTLTMLGIPPPVAMAIVGGADTYAEGGGAKDVAVGTALGGATGALFGGMGSLRQPALRAAATALKNAKDPVAKETALKHLTNLMKSDAAAKDAGGFIEHGVSRMGRPARVGILGGAGAAQSVGMNLAQTGEMPKTEDLAIDTGTMIAFGLMGGPGDRGMRNALLKRGFPEENVNRLSYSAVKRLWQDKQQYTPPPAPPEPPTGMGTVNNMFAGDPRLGTMEGQGPSTPEARNAAQIREMVGEEAIPDWQGRPQERPKMEQTELQKPEPMMGGVEQPQENAPFFPGMTEAMQAEAELGRPIGGMDLNPKKTAENKRLSEQAQAAKDRRGTNAELLIKKKGFRQDIIDILEDSEVDKLVALKASTNGWELDPKDNTIKQVPTKKGTAKAPKNMKSEELEFEVARTLNGDRAQALQTELAKRKAAKPTTIETALKEKEESTPLEDILGDKETARRAEIQKKKEAEGKSASVKMMLTHADRKALSDLGFTAEDIGKMKPDEGAALIVAGKKKVETKPVVEKVTDNDVKKAKADVAEGNAKTTLFKRRVAEWTAENKTKDIPGKVLDDLLDMNGLTDMKLSDILKKLDDLQKVRVDALKDTEKRTAEYKKSIVIESKFNKKEVAPEKKVAATKPSITPEKVLEHSFKTEESAVAARKVAGLNPETYPIVQRGEFWKIFPKEEALLGGAPIDLTWKSKETLKEATTVGEKLARAEKILEGKKRKVSVREKDMIDDLNLGEVPEGQINLDDATMDAMLKGKPVAEILDINGQRRGALTIEELDMLDVIRGKPLQITAPEKKPKEKIVKKAKTVREPFLDETAAEANMKKGDAVAEILGDKPASTEPWVAKNVADAPTIQDSLFKKTKAGVIEGVKATRTRLEKLYKGEHDLEAQLVEYKKRMAGTLDDREYNTMKALESEIAKIRSEIVKDRETLALAAKKAPTGSSGLDVGESKPLLLTGPFPKDADNQAAIVQTRVADNTNEFSVFMGKDPRKPPTKENPGSHQAAVKVELVDGKPTVTFETMNPALDKGYMDALLDKVIDQYSKGDKPKQVEINATDSPKLAEAMERRKPVSHDTITLGSGLGFIGDIDSLVNIKAVGRGARNLMKGAVLGWRKVTDTGGMKREVTPNKEGKKAAYTRYTPEEEMAYLHQIVSLRGQVEPSLFDPEIRKDLKLRDYLSLLDYFGDPIQSMDPKIRTSAALSQKREYAEQFIISQAAKYGKEHFGWLEGKPEKQKELIQHLHELAVSRDPQIIQAAMDYRKLMEDFARVGDLKAKGMWIDKYSTINYDYNKMFEYFSKPIKEADSYEKLPNRLSAYIRPEDFPELKRIVDTYGKAPFDKLPAEVQDVMLSKVFGWTGATTWQDAPAHIQAMVPKEKWNAYFEHRTAGDSLKMLVKENFFDMFNTYVASTARAITAEPYLREVRPIVNSMPGATNWFSKRSYLEKYVKSQLWGRSSPIDKVYNAFAGRINKETYDLWKVQPMPLYLPSKVSAKVQQWTYRGTLGPDTAIRNLLQNMNTFAEGGNVPVFKALKARMEGSKEWKDFSENMGVLKEFGHHTGVAESNAKKGLAGKINKFDNKITEYALSPLNLTENVNKFVAYMQGLENARAKGLDFNQAHLVGIERAFSVLENPEMSVAQWHAWSEVWKSQFGYTPSHQSPIMRDPIGRMSTIFWSYPAKTAQMWRTGIHESAIAGQDARLLRYAGLVGFNLTAHFWLGKTLGIDLSTLFGAKGLLPQDLTPMWMKLAKDAYTAAGGGDAPQQDQDQASESVGEMLKTLFLPQYRYVKKASPVEIPYVTQGKGTAWKNIDRGYSTYGKNEQPLAETNVYQQILNMAGFPPLAPKEMRDFRKELKDEEARIIYYRGQAINDILKVMETKEYSKAYEKIREYRNKGIKVTMSDVADAKKRRELDVLETFQKRGSKQVRAQYGQEIEEMQKKYLPSFRNGRRPMWSTEE